MAFQIPRNVPAFSDPQRRLEDTIWRARNSDSLNAVFGNKNALPMYKDKPYYYGTSERRMRMLRKRTLIVGALVLFGFAWWFGILPWSGSSASPEEQGESWKKLKDETETTHTKKGKVNWLDRRDKVKDAFKLSWSAYEKHGWGTAITQ